MSSGLPSLTAREIVRVIERKGFQKVRQSGSHAIYKHPDGRRVTVPIHSGKNLGKGLLHTIMKDAELSNQDLAK